MEIYERRNAVARVRIEVQGKRDAIDRVRDDKQRLLGSVRAHAHEIHEDIEAMERQQAKIEAEIRAAQGGGIDPGGPDPRRRPLHLAGQRPGHQRLRLPRRPRDHEIPPGARHRRPEGTPIRAGGSGTVILAGYNGGYGNYTCIDHGGARFDLLRAPVRDPRERRPARLAGPGDRPRRQHRLLVRRPPPLRGARERRRHAAAQLPRLSGPPALALTR